MATVHKMQEQLHEKQSKPRQKDYKLQNYKLSWYYPIKLNYHEGDNDPK